MEAEFGVQALWTAEAVRELGPEYAIPAACKGSASPAMLRWLGQVCGLRENDVLADVGGGLGGPAAFAAREYRVRPIVLEPMVEACRAARSLFGVPALSVLGDRLPLADGCADAVWCLGVLCTTPDKPALLEEIARVLKPGAGLGMLVFTADEPRPAGAPEGNEFPCEDELPGLLEKHGLEVAAVVAGEGLQDHGQGWTRWAAEVSALVGRRHAGDPRLDEAREQERRIGELIADGTVRARLLGAVRR
ncbi:SAM-dependent methyltransferase [Kineosporia sp. NBRC 101731]|nr:SAM-dependent methyltransferase [Kineosporia sp. NBRC 101731]